jgi:hypothetical protein
LSTMPDVAIALSMVGGTLAPVQSYWRITAPKLDDLLHARLSSPMSHRAHLSAYYYRTLK